jgi:hypothetical protein
MDFAGLRRWDFGMSKIDSSTDRPHLHIQWRMCRNNKRMDEATGDA